MNYITSDQPAPFSLIPNAVEPRYLDVDAIKTLEDVKAVLRVLKLAVSGDAAKEIEHLLVKK